jgi:hypothetical protein
MKAPKKFGAPPKKNPKPGERVALSLRMTPELKSKLDAAAEQGGRSQSQEAEFRLERTFQYNELLEDALKLAYDKEIAGILLLLGEVMNAAVRRSYIHRATKVDGRIDWDSVDANYYWADDPNSYDEVLKGAITVLLILGNDARPAGPPNVDEEKLSAIVRLAWETVRNVSRLPATGLGLGAARYIQIRSLLGAISERLKDANP